jgi:hypothetical protein
MMMERYIILIISLLLVEVSFASEKDCNKDIVAYLNCNNTIVIDYLSSLSEEDIGRKLNGIELSDQNIILNGYKFLGKSTRVDQSIHLYLFEFDNRHEAFVWIEPKGKKLVIPKCPEDVTSENAYVLSGDVYTWKAVQPDHGVVQIMCTDRQWY